MTAQPPDDEQRTEPAGWASPHGGEARFGTQPQPPAQASGQPGSGQPAAAQPQWGQPAVQQPAPAQPAQQWGQPAYGHQPYAHHPYGQSAYGYGHHHPQYGYGYAPPREPDNSTAVAGFITSLSSLGLLLMTFGLIAPLTMIGSIVGIFVSRAGVKKVERGETRKSKSMGQWGFWLGIAGLILGALALAAWIVAIVNDPTLFDENPNGGGDPALMLP